MISGLINWLIDLVLSGDVLHNLLHNNCEAVLLLQGNYTGWTNKHKNAGCNQ